jgi:hypothetical protein
MKSGLFLVTGGHLILDSWIEVIVVLFPGEVESVGMRIVSTQVGDTGWRVEESVTTGQKHLYSSHRLW